MQLKKIYAAHMKHGKEFLKALICILLIFNRKNVYSSLDSFLQRKYNPQDIEYIMRVGIMVMMLVLLVCGIASLSGYIQKNGESLLLLGVTNMDIFRLYFMQRYELLLAIIYLGSFLGRYYQVNIGRGIWANGLNAGMFLLLVIIGYFAVRCTFIRKIFYFLMMILSAFFALGKVNYKNVYQLVMSEWLGDKICSFLSRGIFLKILFLFLLGIIAKRMLDCQGLMAESQGRNYRKNNFFGDWLHRMGKYSSFRKNYLWLYRDKDFLLWKICSTVFLAVFCGYVENTAGLIIACYVIGLITASYFFNIYQFERKQLIVYYLSDYTFKDLIKAHVKSGVAIMGDNIFAILLIYGIGNIKCLIAIFVTYILFLLIGLFVCTALYKKYPQKIYWLEFIIVLVEMNIPIWNLGIGFRNYFVGKEKWSKLEYGEKQ